MDETVGERGVDHEVVAAARGKTVVAVDPGRANTDKREQGEYPHVALAKIGRDIEAQEKRPGGNAHGDRYEDDERREFDARAKVAEITACITCEHLFTEHELLASGADESE